MCFLSFLYFFIAHFKKIFCIKFLKKKNKHMSYRKRQKQEHGENSFLKTIYEERVYF